MKELKVKRFFVSPYILVWLGIFLCLLCGRIFAAIPASERAVLIKLYNSAHGDEYHIKDTWKKPPLAADGFALPGTEENWHGITCNSTNTAVLEIHLYYTLQGTLLPGTLPPELVTLTNLKRLCLSGHISGGIPPELGSLTYLQDLYLSGYYISGSIPPELGNLTNLQSLNLSGDNLSGGIPPELGNLSNLEWLQIYDCKGLTGGIPPELGSLGNLYSLHICYTGLDGSIPPELGSLTNLFYLVLVENNLSGSIPPELGNLTNLEEFFLAEDNLSGTIPPELGGLTNLQTLSLSGSSLNGSIPPELGNLSNLEFLFIHGSNGLTGGIPPELGNLSNLEYLQIYDCKGLTGGIPPELGNLSNLEFLHIYGCNGLTGGIPPELASLGNLYSLDISYTGLDGSIPPELGNLTNLYILRLDFNKLTGSIPASLGNLTGLGFLYLNCNCLSGEIPASLQNLVNFGGSEVIFPGKLNFCWNALYTKNAALRDFIDFSHDPGCNWQATQTVAPGQFSASTASPYSIDLQWEPIAYTTDPGCYRVFYKDSAQDSFKFFGRTVDKYASSKTVTGLKPGTTYYFTIRTRTDPHSYNQNTVDSEFSRVVSAATEPIFYTISGTVTSNGGGLGGVALALSNISNTAKASRAAGIAPRLSKSGETVFTDARGNYRAVVDYGWSGKITPVKGYYRFTPAFRTYTPVYSDQFSQDFSAEIPLTITIRSERKTERAYIISRDYGLITLSVENSGGIPDMRFVIERKVVGESYRAIKEFAAAELVNGAYVYYDKFLEKDKTYTYRLIAYDAGGTVLTVSSETSI